MSSSDCWLVPPQAEQAGRQQAEPDSAHPWLPVNMGARTPRRAHRGNAGASASSDQCRGRSRRQSRRGVAPGTSVTTPTGMLAVAR